MRLPRVAALLSLFAVILAHAEDKRGIFGDWQSKAGSIVRIEHCADQVCMRLVQIINTAGASTDVHNPDLALRNRSLCGLTIGNSFKLTNPNHAEGGVLYDPKSGKTYHGNLTAEGATLHLRGYIGVPLFGASENWSRPANPVKDCFGD